MPLISDQIVILTGPELKALEDAAFQRGFSRGHFEARAGLFDLPLKLGDVVEKDGGDYRFVGEVMAAFRKRNGTSLRYVVENDDGVLHIFGDGQLKPIAGALKPHE